MSVSALAVISVTFSACIFLLMSELAGKDAKIAEMEGEIRNRILEIAALESGSVISCGDSFFGTPSGKRYLELTATADEDGSVLLELHNVHADPVFVINIREVLVHYDKEEKRIDADLKSAPTFSDFAGDSTCRGSIDPGESLTCVSDSYYSERAKETMDSGGNTLLIKYLTAELDIEPYYFVSSDLCVAT